MKLEGHYFVTVAESEKSPLGDLKMNIGHFAKSYADLLKSGTPMVDFRASFWLVPQSEVEKAGDNLDNLAIEYAKQCCKWIVEEKEHREALERGEYNE